MRNLWPCLTEVHSLASTIKANCLDSIGKRLYYLDNTGALTSIELSTGRASTQEWPELADSLVVYLEYIQLSEQLLVVTSDELLTVGESVESQGLIPDGILAAACAPSQEIFAIATQAGKLLLMNLYFDVTAEVEIPHGTAASLSWRADSKFFALTIKSSEGVRAFTYSASGQLVISSASSDPDGGLVQLVSEKFNLLTASTIAYQPNGSLIAGVYGNTIRFWEKNGLVHGGLNHNQPIEALAWSADSEVLSVHSGSSVSLYVRSNYHWYLKQIFEVVGLVSAMWQVSSSLILVGQSLTVLELKWSYDVAEDYVVVVDGPSLKVTEFAKAVIPPPMFSYEIKIAGVPSALHCGVTHKVLIIGDEMYEVQGKAVALVAKLRSSGTPCNLSVKEDSAFYIADQSLWQVSLSSSEISESPLDFTCLGIAPSRVEGLWLQDKKGMCRNGDRTYQLPTTCIYFASVLAGLHEELVGLQRNTSKLYVGKRLVSSNSTNFAILNGALAFVENSAGPLNTLALLEPENLARFLDNDQVKLPEPSSDQFITRHVERGSRLVTAWGISLVLQMPRGNLELIAPRSFVLNAVKVSVISVQYLKAFLLLKKHRIDFNLLYDIAPDLFFDRLSDFLQQIGDADSLNLFLAALKDEDFEANYYGVDSKPSAGKVSAICEAVRAQLSPSTHILSIVTTFAKQSKFADALFTITSYSDPASRDVALKYLCWLGNPEALYEVALSTFDLELTLKVAQHTQKDPKEYLPYLQKLKVLSPILMKIQILSDLKQYSKALEILSKSGDEGVEAALELTKAHNLHVQAIELYKGSAHWELFASGFGDYLASRGLYAQAGAMYRASGKLSAAREAYRQARDWRMFLAIAGQEGLDVVELASEESTQLAEQGDFESAADLLKLVDIDRGTLVSSLLRIHAYLEAVSASIGYHNLEQLVRSSILSQTGVVLDDIRSSIDTWRQKLVRLQHVQKHKRSMPQSQLHQSDETASEYSVDSRTSKATQMGKRKRKTAKKLRKTAAKEGSQFEEEYLVDLLKTLKPDKGFQERVDAVSKALVQVGEVGKVAELLGAYDELVRETTEIPYTLRQLEFTNKFYEAFPDVPQDDSAKVMIGDLALRSYFLTPEKREAAGILALQQYLTATRQK
mmetsp:Transcript_11114/g.21789  ORF Transcript_11114/g.21789 Transcript_11114/m.21789 type:complete len:1140 (+) Transcript_11114:1462-4881(+)|eukprot:CAMPEP_0204896540 /NCGR_PEP_ID=MMETSP1397-20131031/221_1 /ASSEMBLY_ACC=CAM_ASM_000891 /TAXON_ID=49980 /ORGANISM="Climacostomum Climacostomum virens, Strain Stock W-24" /LENGTH=1139 /DNA_ID=CAMNT_0052064163 /DNA_START=622 /DNA_END=4041 /DNA_ORIENTATION=+